MTGAENAAISVLGFNRNTCETKHTITNQKIVTELNTIKIGTKTNHSKRIQASQQNRIYLCK